MENRECLNINDFRLERQEPTTIGHHPTIGLGI